MGAICNMGEFGMGVICNMGNLQYGRFANRPYDARKRTHTMPVMLFCVFTRMFANVRITHV